MNFQDAVIDRGAKWNSCHDSQGRFCSTGAGGLGGVSNEKVRQQVIKGIRQVQSHGLTTGNEAIVGYDINGNQIDSMPTGDNSSVDQEPIMNKDTYAFVHNHPTSSSFSDGDFGVFATSPAQHMIVIGHDGTLYKLSKPSNWVSPSGDYATYAMAHQNKKQDLMPKYQKMFNEGGNGNTLWKEHSHEIMKALSKEYGFDYTRVLPK